MGVSQSFTQNLKNPLYFEVPYLTEFTGSPLNSFCNVTELILMTLVSMKACRCACFQISLFIIWRKLVIMLLTNLKDDYFITNFKWGPNEADIKCKESLNLFSR